MNVSVEDIQVCLNNDLPAPLPAAASVNELQQQLAIYLNDLISRNFDQLLYILYRVDVDEARLKKMLAEHPNEDAGMLIAGMLIERQLLKIKTRESFNNAGNDTGEERW